MISNADLAKYASGDWTTGISMGQKFAAELLDTRKQLVDANEHADRLYRIVNGEDGDPNVYISLVRAQHRARLQSAS